MVDNLKLHEQINEALKARQKLLEKHTSELTRQAQLSNQLKDSVKEIEVDNQVLDDMKKLKKAMEETLEVSEDQQELNEKLNESAKEGYEDTASGLEDWTERLKQAHAETGHFAVFIGGFVSGLESWFGFLKKGLTSALSLLSTAVGLTLQLGKTILALPISIFSGFVDIANSFHGGTALRQAFEDIRKQFGDFKTGVSQDVIGAAKNLRGTLEHTGISSFRVFGLLHEKLNLVRETLTEMGPIAHQFSDEIYRNAEVILQFQKALGMTNESMGAMGIVANRNFTTMADMQREVANQSLQMGERFGIDQKLISRDISEMVQDFDNFGSVGTKEMASLSVFARKLGVDFKELLGVVEGFDNFEDAAENAAKLAQSFGLNINAFEMMKEQDPGARIEMLRKQFFLTGKSIEGMDRQERALLATTAKVKEGQLDAVFGAKNQALSYDTIQKASEGAEKAQLTQAEALSKLSDSIERLVKSGQRQGGFWDRFTQGFRKGIFWSKDFFKTIRNIKRSLWAAERAGRQVGRAFVKYFPGVKTFIQGVREFFDPATFKILTGGVVDIFRQFFKDLSNPATSAKALDRLFKNFKSVFGKMVEAETGAVGKIVGGFKKFFITLGEIALHGIRIVMNKFADFADMLSKAIEDPRPFTEALRSLFKAGEGEAKTLVQKLLGTISKILGPAWKRLKPAAIRLFGNVWESVKEFTKKWWDSLKWGEILTSTPAFIIAGLLFGPPFIKAGAGVLLNSILKMFTSRKTKQAIEKAGGKIGCSVAGETCGSKLGEGMEKGTKKMFPTFSKIGTKVGGLLGQNAIGSMKGLFTGGGLAKLGLVGAALSAGIAAGMALDKAFGISDWISKKAVEWDGTVAETTKKINNNYDSIRKQQIIHDKSRIKNQELMNVLKKGEKYRLKEINVLLESGKLTRIEDQKIALKNMQIEQQRIINARVTEMSAKREMEVKRGAAGLKQVESLRKEAIQNLLSSGQIEVDPKILGEQLAELTQKIIPGAFKEQAKKVDPIKLGVEDLEFLKKIEEIDESKIENLKETFEKKIKPALIGPGGIRSSMDEIVKAFEFVDIGRFQNVAATIDQAATIPRALNALAKMSIKTSTVEGIANDLRTTAAVLSVAFDYIDTNMIDSDLTKMMSNVSNFAIGSTGVLQNFVDMQRNLSEFDGKKINDELFDFRMGLDAAFYQFGQMAMPTADLPVIKGITDTVAAVNAISTQLNSLQEINATAKLKALGTAVGLGATGKFEVNNKPVSITINLDVTMDAGTVGNELVKAQVVLAGPKAKGYGR